MLRLFLFVTMTPHSWQQTENYITWKFGDTVAIKVFYSHGKKSTKSRIFDEICFC